MRSVFVALGAVAVLAAGACTGGGLDAGEARLQADGRVEVAASGEEYRLVSSTRTVRSGDRVRVTSGSAVLRLADGGTLELRDGSELEVGRPTRLLAGDALAVAGDDPLTVEAEPGRAVVETGAARVSKALNVVAASYRGSLELSTFGRSLTVPALRQAAMPAAGVVPAAPSPLDYDEADPWDRRYLGVAMELSGELEARSRGFSSQMPGEGRTPGFFSVVLPELDAQPGYGPVLIDPQRSPGETLVGATIVLQADGGTFVERWDEVFGFRRAGAAWGLVALDQGVTDIADLRGQLDAALSRAPQPLAQAPPGATDPATGAPDAVVGPVAPVAPATGPGAPGPGPAPSAPPPTVPSEPGPAPGPALPGEPLAPPPDDGPAQGLLTPLTDTVGGVLDGLLR